ncbi:MAG: hypothetical protein ACTHJT_12870 [Cytophaga sp.]|uniref:hypothetical protein n=1 Tax=Cytophaga sp. TaxID=29535 RepID=UPI003F8116FF
MIFKPNSTFINKQGMSSKEETNQSIMDVFKTRIFSPVMSGFIISWLVINWEIPYATLFLSAEDIAPINKIGYIKFVIKTYDRQQWMLVWKPSLFALGFTLILPVFKYGIDYYIEWIKKIYLRGIEKLQKDYPLLKERNQKIEESSRRIKDEFVDIFVVEKIISFEKFMKGTWRIIFNPTHQEFNSVYYADNKFYAQNENSKLLFECEYIGLNSQDNSVDLNINKRFDHGFEGRYRLMIADREKLIFRSIASPGYDISLYRVSYISNISTQITI